MIPTLRSAFDEVYTVFARYEDPLQCVRQSGINRPLYLLTRKDWDNIHKDFDMPVLLGDSTLFCHFLPRLLEWAHEADSSDAEFGRWGLWELGHRLTRFGWTRWPCDEVRALARVFGFWTTEALLNPERNISNPLDLLLDVEDDLHLYLNPWIQTRPKDAARWITQQDWSHPKTSILKWVKQSFVDEQLAKAFWVNPDGEEAALISRSIQLIESLRTTDI